MPAVAALLHPDEQRRVVAEGHEIGIHGWIHELNSVLPYEAERDLMLRSADTLEKITGVRPVGLRTPSWDFSPNTLRIEKEMGLLYDSSLMADEDCYELLLDGEPTGIVELPVEWVRDDAVYFMMNRFQSLRPYTPPADVLDIFRRELDAAYEEGGLFQLTMHPHIIGYRSRIWILDELIRHAQGASPASGSRPTPRWRAGRGRTAERRRARRFGALAAARGEALDLAHDDVRRDVVRHVADAGEHDQLRARDLALERARMQMRPHDVVGLARDDDGRAPDVAVALGLDLHELVAARHVLRVRPESRAAEARAGCARARRSPRAAPAARRRRRPSGP